MKVLAAGAHPDDIEIFMYGLVTILQKEGHEIHLLVATDGSLGGNISFNNIKKMRANETTLALSNIGKLNLLDLPDGSLGDDISHKEILRETINFIKPDLIITHYKKDYHTDHRALSNLITSIASHYIPILFCDTLMGLNFTPNYYVDVSKFFELKKEAVLKHKSQKPSRFIDLITLMNSYRAAQCNAPKGRYSEAYFFNSSFPFSDIRNILPKAMDLRPFHISKINGFL